jgi:hypothetical protein
MGKNLLMPHNTIVEVGRSQYPGTMTFAQATDKVLEQPGVTGVTLTTNSARVVFNPLYVTLTYEAPLMLDGSALDEYLQFITLNGPVAVRWIDTYHLFEPTSDDMFVVRFDISESVTAAWPYRTSDIAYIAGSRPAAEYGHLSVVESDRIKLLYNIASLKEVLNAH